MRNSTTQTTIQRHVGEFNTSLIARLKLSKKLIITRSRQEKSEQKKPVSNPKLGPLSGRVTRDAVGTQLLQKVSVTNGVKGTSEIKVYNIGLLPVVESLGYKFYASCKDCQQKSAFEEC